MTVPVRIAQGMTETGAASLGMVLASHGLRVGQEELRLVCGTSRDGTDLDVLAEAARTYNFDAQVVRGGLVALEQATLPALVSWGSAHVVVVEGRKGDHWYIVDSLSGRFTRTTDELAHHVGDQILTIEPKNDFQRASTQPRLPPILADGVTGSWGGVVFVVVAGLALVVPGLITPAFVRMFVDTYLVDGSTDAAQPIILGLSVSILLLVALLTLQRLGLRRLLTASVTRTSAHFLWHVMRMPAWFYGQRDATTLAYRVGLNEKLADTVSGQFAIALLAQLTSIFYLIGMVIFSPILAFISALGLLLSLLLVMRVARMRSEVRQRQAREAAVTATQLGVSLRMLETLKATGSEDVAFTRIYSAIGRRLTLGYTHLWGYLSMIPVLCQSVTGSLVLGVGAYLVMQGQLNVGTLTAFILLLGGFLAPIAVLVPSIDAALNLRGTLDQLEDVMNQQVDVSLWDDYADGPRPERVVSVSPREVGATAKEVVAEGTDDLDLLLRSPRSRRAGLTIDPWAATLELRDVTFGYSPTAPPLLRSVSIVVPAGHIVAIVGASGSGKSTIGRLVAGLYQPWSGQVMLDGRDLLDHSQAQRARDLAFVDQDVVIYRATVRDNITMFNPDIPDRQVVAAAVDAQLHEEIIDRPGGYDAPVAEDGRDRSGGQRQRMVIARALVRQPRLIVLDEATSALDARTEAGVVEGLRARACTALLVAHRLSTVRDADEIIVMDKGVIADRGTHTQLASRDGVYRQLMNA